LQPGRKFFCPIIAENNPKKKFYVDLPNPSLENLPLDLQADGIKTE
jgi:hypothetical protein